MNDNNGEKIFIQIASYRDPELIPTLNSIIHNANKPSNLRIVVSWQHSDDEKIEQFVNNDINIVSKKEYNHTETDGTISPYNIIQCKHNTLGAIVELIDIPYNESKGACWARNLIQTQYNEEEYTLQLDSHHRLIPHWDRELINMLLDLQKDGFKKPLLTAYIPSYNPENDPEDRVNRPWWMIFDRFIPEGAIFFLPRDLPNWHTAKKPIRSRFYSAHFAFTLGCFAKEVMHDPNYYFHGEEISIAVRAFTYGYDLFHPHKVIAWHEYTRKGRTKHWDDDSIWHTRNLKSHERNRILFGMQYVPNDKYNEMFKLYGFGKERTLKDYEEYSGIRFKDRAVQQYTIDNKIPPNPKLSGDELDKSYMKIYKHCIDINKSVLSDIDYQFCVVAFHDNNGDTIYRKDLDEREIKNLISSSDREGIDYVKIWSEFHYDGGKVSYWVVWPYDKEKGWCEKITGNLEYE